MGMAPTRFSTKKPIRKTPRRVWPADRKKVGRKPKDPSGLTQRQLRITSAVPLPLHSFEEVVELCVKWRQHIPRNLPWFSPYGAEMRLSAAEYEDLWADIQMSTRLDITVISEIVDAAIALQEWMLRHSDRLKLRAKWPQYVEKGVKIVRPVV